jgi:hypothetical protein
VPYRVHRKMAETRTAAAETGMIAIAMPPRALRSRTLLHNHSKSAAHHVHRIAT